MSDQPPGTSAIRINPCRPGDEWRSRRTILDLARSGGPESLLRVPGVIGFVLAASLSALSALAGDGADEVARLRDEAAAAAEKDPSAARDRLLEALELAPMSPDVLADLLVLAGDDADQALVRALLLARRTADAKGRVARPVGVRGEAKSALDIAATLAKKRVDALVALAKVAKKLKAPVDAPVARRLLQVGRELARGSDAVEAVHLAPLEDAVRRCAVDRDELVARLRRAVAGCAGDGAWDDAFAGARALRGLGVHERRASGAVQATPLEQEAFAVLDRARAARWEDAARVLTVDDLRAVPHEERPAWDRAHATWRSPALVTSPSGLYRIESVCGLRSTGLVAVDVEAVHRRLAAWIGKDPFAGRIGTIRLVRGDADMEGEGQSLLWARAFNAGEVTISPVHITSRRWLARGFSHELTHRFDGELYGALPGWLREGRANHAQVASTVATADEFDQRAVDFDMLGRAARAGYADSASLKALLSGRPRRPQDDYDVGYALWLYLSRRAGDAYGSRLEPYLASHRKAAGGDPAARLSQHLADGAEGRAKGLDAFARDFAAFLADVTAASLPTWVREWQAQNAAATAEADAQRRASGAENEFAGAADQEIFDRSNHLPHRKRYVVPEFGEAHAFAAGRFFAATDDAEGAAAAFAWSQEVDEPTRERLREIAAFHDASGNDASAWAVRCELAEFHGEEFVDEPLVPADVARALRALRDALRGRPRAAAALHAEADVLASLLGVAADDPGTAVAEPEPAIGIVADLTADAWAPGGVYVGAPDGPWTTRDPYDVVLGTDTAGPRSDGAAPELSGTRAPLFVRSGEVFDAAISFRARVVPRTAATIFGVVVGRTRADRGTLIEFSSGAGGALTVRIDDLRDSDWGVCVRRATTTLASQDGDYDLALDVLGAAIRVRIDDLDVLSFRTATGAPLRGEIGLLLTAGSAEVRRPRVARLPGRPRFDVALADLAAAPRASWSGREFVDLPRDPLGTLLLVVPGGAGEPGAVLAQAAKSLGPADHTARIRVLVPGGADAAAPEWEREFPGRVHRMAGHGVPGAAGPLWCAVDEHGVIRSTGSWTERDPQIHRLRTLLHRVRGW